MTAFQLYQFVHNVSLNNDGIVERKTLYILQINIGN